MESIPLMKLSFLSKDINVKTRKASRNTDSDMQEILRGWWSLANHIGWTGQKSIIINRDWWTNKKCSNKLKKVEDYPTCSEE